METNASVPGRRNVKVEIYLAGGHCHTTTLPSDSPLLHDMFAALVSPLDAAMPGFFQIPLDEGRAACSFSSAQLVSLVTEPPVLVQVQRPVVQPDPAPVVPSDHLLIDDFLTPDEQAQVYAYTLQHAADFEASTVTDGSADTRHSQVYFGVQDDFVAGIFRHRLQVLLPYLLRRFKRAPFPVSRIEVQLTAHQGGDYFRIHKDGGGDASTALREITYVYYFHREPKAFSGGELRLYNGRIENGKLVAATDSFHVITPRHNSLVVFLSNCFHEVLPVQSASTAFVDSRFTINGWINREADPVPETAANGVMAHA